MYSTMGLIGTISVAIYCQTLMLRVIGTELGLGDKFNKIIDLQRMMLNGCLDEEIIDKKISELWESESEE